MLSVGTRSKPRGGEFVKGDGTARGPRDVGQDPEDPVEIDRARLHQTVGEQVQAQVGIGSTCWRYVEIDFD